MSKEHWTELSVIVSFLGLAFLGGSLLTCILLTSETLKAQRELANQKETISILEEQVELRRSCADILEEAYKIRDEQLGIRNQSSSDETTEL